MSVDQSKIYKVWSGMKNRCTNPNNRRYKDYGGRGITVCDRWLTFSNFKEDMVDSYKEGLQLDRIDNHKGYSKENCKWSTPKEQSNNTRNIERAKKFTYKGVENTISYWANQFGMRRETSSKRLLHLGWDFERAISTAPDFSNKPEGFTIKRNELGQFLRKTSS